MNEAADALKGHEQTTKRQSYWSLLRDQAREEFEDKLKAGKSVRGCFLRDLIDSELQGERYKILLEDFEGLLLTEAGAERIREGLIERFLKPEWIQERAEEIDAENAAEGD